MLEENYIEVTKIGQGRSEVKLVKERKTGIFWAAKTMKRPEDEEAYAEFWNTIYGAKMVQNLYHPGIPKIHEILYDKEAVYILMEYIEGETLQDILKKRGALPFKMVLPIAEGVLSVLAYLHEQKPPVFYRDLKPANIMQRKDNRLVLVDFGTLLILTEKNHGQINCLGTPGYAPREQYDINALLDVRMDIYSFGISMYQLLTNTMPDHKNKNRKKAFANDVPLYLIKMIERCMEPDKTKRYHSVKEMQKIISRKKQPMKWQCIKKEDFLQEKAAVFLVQDEVYSWHFRGKREIFYGKEKRLH